MVQIKINAIFMTIFCLTVRPFQTASGQTSDEQPDLDTNIGQGSPDNLPAGQRALASMAQQAPASHTKASGGGTSIWSGIGNVVTDGLSGLPAEPKSVKGIRYLVRLKGPGHKWTPINDDDFNIYAYWEKHAGTKILIHGFTPGLEKPPDVRINTSGIFHMGAAYYEKNKTTNVIVMDWTSLSTHKHLKYYEAVLSVPHAAKDLADLIMYLHLKKKLILRLADVHVIGFSLGAHVAGGAGFRVRRKLNYKVDKEIGRITGLDPAGAQFHMQGKIPKNMDNVLDPSDATFVDVIHCNMGSSNIGSRVPELDFDFGNYGTPAKSGHADFYPNGGRRQTGCTYWTDKTSCSHNKCPGIFLDTLAKDIRKVACPCKDWETYKAGKCKCDIGNGGIYIGDPENSNIKDLAKKDLKYYLTWP